MMITFFIFGQDANAWRKYNEENNTYVWEKGDKLPLKMKYSMEYRVLEGKFYSSGFINPFSGESTATEQQKEEFQLLRFLFQRLLWKVKN